MLQSLWQKYKKSMLFPGILVLCGLCYFYFSSSDSSPPQEELIETIQPIEENNLIDSTKETAIQQVFVDIKGAVLYPGVYELQQDQRIRDAVQLAGGYTEDADTQLINHAQKVQDEMVIYIPEKGEQLEEGTTNFISLPAENNSNEQKININKADVSALSTLPGIGPSKAQSILSYREENGPFQTIDDLKNVSGIGDKTFEKLQDSITVN
ncbi:helix-hairpin-helix domain-containing protein [Lysinibacillus irui]|uniref:Helix-hairpin-helix domain-containing protein n=1 Tax=Lysinibacillus irui TaxID=2998077 RepID=A0ABU5NL65_9BACI|nr:helix-hairpin-helix domain-containing protein [Lysinibacillus irui]MEA0555009.1 helix-hairpin-helix domain-containing protein [Lysinibacillus irui]MEA0976724.1 helix-hairpin-helix domain-containing protein [Lysinibacillus irui]MEA1042878.1 helix-hairpin-helix domain-containing protein [Lysinibacillus irui]